MIVYLFHNRMVQFESYKPNIRTVTPDAVFKSIR